jgi:hypothetical protein
MNNRRKFLLNSSMATAAFLTAKPFTALANTLAPVTGFSINSNKITLLNKLPNLKKIPATWFFYMQVTLYVKMPEACILIRYWSLQTVHLFRQVIIRSFIKTK